VRAAGPGLDRYQSMMDVRPRNGASFVPDASPKGRIEVVREPMLRSHFLRSLIKVGVE
jgi:hypothetical protein